MLGISHGNISQPVEIHDSEDEQPPQHEGGEDEEELEGNIEKEADEEMEQSGQEGGEEIEQHRESPLSNPLQEDEFAQILANFGKYVQPHSPLNPHTKEVPQEHSAHDKSTCKEMCDEEEEEQSIPSQNTPEELHDEEEAEEEASQGTAKQIRVSTYEKSDQQNTEEMSHEENMEIGQGEGTIPEVQSLGLRKETVVPSMKTDEIKKL